MKKEFKPKLMITYALAKGTKYEYDDKTSEYDCWRKPLYEYLMEQDEKFVEFVRTIMYVGRAVFTGETFSGSKEDIYKTYNSCKDPKDISVSEICSKTPLHEYLKSGFEYFELDVLRKGN